MPGSISKFLTLMIFLCAGFFAFSLPERNYYEILGVSAEAKPNEIVHAYRKQAMKHHPDRTIKLGVETTMEIMAKINEAYSVLKNPKSRRQYDEFLSSAAAGFSHIIDRIDFYFAFEQAVSPYSHGFSKAMWFYVMDEMRGELNDQQIHSIVKVIVDVENEYELVRRAGITVLEHYFKQLYIGDIELLLILSSSRNKMDDQDLKQLLFKKTTFFMDRISRKNLLPSQFKNQNFEEPEKEIGIKKRAERITDKWFVHKFHHSRYIDQILKIAAGSDDQYVETNGSDFLRKGVLDVLENNVEKLNFSQVQQLQSFSKSSRWSRRLRRRAKRVVKRWKQLGVHEKGAALEEFTGGRRNLIRSAEEANLYSKDPDLYSIKSLGEAYNYLKSHLSLPAERVQEIVDYTLNFIHSFDSGMQFILLVRDNDKKFSHSSKDKVIDKTILHLHRLDEVQRLMKAAGGLLSENHLDQMFNQVLPFIETQRGLRGGTRFLRFIKEYANSVQQKRMIEMFKNLSANTALDAEKFIDLAGEYLSEEDRSSIRSRIKTSVLSCSGSFQKKH